MSSYEELKEMLIAQVIESFQAGRKFQIQRIVERLNTDPIVRGFFNAKDLAHLIEMIENDEPNTL